MKATTLVPGTQMLIKMIATEAAEHDKLDFAKCYATTLLYYLAQFSGFKIEEMPEEYQPSVRLLYKDPKSSYIHYRMDIFYSTDNYAKSIKDAEIKLMGGDDPRCPWS